MHTLKEYGIIKELNIDNLKNKYEIAAQKKHHHLVCKVCGDVIDVFLDTTQIAEQTQQLEGFDVDYCEVFCYGVCNKCKEKQKGN